MSRACHLAPDAQQCMDARQRRLAWQMAAVVLLPLPAWWFLSSVKEPAWFAFMWLYAMFALIMLTLVLKWFRLRLDKLRAGPRLKGGGAFAFLVVALVWAVMGAIPAWQVWTDEGPDAPASAYRTVRGEVPAAPFEQRSGRARHAYLKIGDVLLSCQQLFADDCPAIRHHAGRMAEISYRTVNSGLNVVHEVRIDGQMLRSHQTASEQFRHYRQWLLQKFALILVFISLPHLWTWYRIRGLIREVDRLREDAHHGSDSSS